MTENNKTESNNGSLSFKRMIKNNLARSAAILALMSASLMKSDAGLLDYFWGENSIPNKIERGIERWAERSGDPRNVDHPVREYLKKTWPGLLTTGYGLHKGVSWLVPGLDSKILSAMSGLGSKMLSAMSGVAYVLGSTGFKLVRQYPKGVAGGLMGALLVTQGPKMWRYLSLTEGAGLAYNSDAMEDCIRKLKNISEKSKWFTERLDQAQRTFLDKETPDSKQEVISVPELSAHRAVIGAIQEMKREIKKVRQAYDDVDEINENTILSAAKRKDFNRLNLYQDRINKLNDVTQMVNEYKIFTNLNTILNGFVDLETNYIKAMEAGRFGFTKNIADMQKVYISQHEKLKESYIANMEVLKILEDPLNVLLDVNNKLIQMPESH